MADLAKHDRVVIAWQRFGPYHHARLRATARRMPVIGLQSSTVDKINYWAPVAGDIAYETRTLLPDRDPDATKNRKIRVLIDRLLRDVRVRALAIHGWSDRVALMLLEWGVKHDVPTIMMSSTWQQPPRKHSLRTWAKCRLVTHCGAALAGGTRAAQYLEDIRIPRERIFFGYDAVDNHHFMHGAELARLRSDALTHTLHLPRRYFLTSCRFIPEKNLSRLLDAFSIYRKTSRDTWDLVIIGDGPLRASVERRVTELAIKDCVLMPGFKQYDELPNYYGLASAFVLPSVSETWGLVVNEAMASGLPVLVSKLCGCAVDLVQDGVNGYTFDPHDVEQLAGLMSKVSSGDCDREMMGRASQRIIADWGPERFAEGLAKAVAAAESVECPPAAWFDRVVLSAMIRR